MDRCPRAIVEILCSGMLRETLSASHNLRFEQLIGICEAKSKGKWGWQCSWRDSKASKASPFLTTCYARPLRAQIPSSASVMKGTKRRSSSFGLVSAWREENIKLCSCDCCKLTCTYLTEVLYRQGLLIPSHLTPLPRSLQYTQFPIATKRLRCFPAWACGTCTLSQTCLWNML